MPKMKNRFYYIYKKKYTSNFKNAYKQYKNYKP